MPLPPRLARMLVAADGATSMARACALLSERHVLAPRGSQAQATTSDLLSAVDRWSSVPPHVQRVAREIEQIATNVSHGEPFAVRGGLPPGRARRLSRSRGAAARAPVASRPPGVWRRRRRRARKRRHRGRVPRGARRSLVELRRPRGRSQDGSNASIRLASLVEREWLAPNATEVVHRFDPGSGSVKATILTRYDALVLTEQSTTPDPEVAAALLAEAWLARGPDEDDQQLLRRLRFAGRPADPQTAGAKAPRCGARSLDGRGGIACAVSGGSAGARSRRAGRDRRSERPLRAPGIRRRRSACRPR